MGDPHLPMSPDRIVAFTDRCSRPYGEFPDRREVFAGLVETDQRTLILPTVDQPPGGSVLRPQLRGDRQDPRREDLAIVIAHFGANRTRRDAAERDRPPSVAPGVGLVLDGGPMRRDVRKDRARSLRDADQDPAVLPEREEPERAVRRLHLIQDEPALVVTVHRSTITLCRPERGPLCRRRSTRLELLVELELVMDRDPVLADRRGSRASALASHGASPPRAVYVGSHGSEGTHEMRIEDQRVGVRLRISALWIATLFLFAYGDIFGFFKPGQIEEVIAGEIAGSRSPRSSYWQRRSTSRSRP